MVQYFTTPLFFEPRFLDHVLPSLSAAATSLLFFPKLCIYVRPWQVSTMLEHCVFEARNQNDVQPPRLILKFCQASLRSSRSISSSSSAQKMRQIRDDSPLIVKEDRQTTSLASHDSGGAASGKRENENDFLFFRGCPSLRTFSQENGKSNGKPGRRLFSLHQDMRRRLGPRPYTSSSSLTEACRRLLSLSGVYIAR